MININFFQKNFQKNMRKGFTLIEVIVAISVITIGIIGIYNLVPRIVSITSANANRFIVSQLAREGIEVVRNIRDTNWLQGRSFDTGLEQGENYGVQYNGDSLIDNYGSVPLQFNAEGFYGYNGKFGYSGGVDTGIKREIIIKKINDYILNVKVKITWPGERASFVAEENLYDWQ